MAEWLRHPPVETLVVTGLDPGLAKNLFLHFFLTKMNTVLCENQKVVIPYVHDFSLMCEIKITFAAV